MFIKSVVLGLFTSSLLLPLIASAADIESKKTVIQPEITAKEVIAPASPKTLGVVGKIGTLGLGVELIKPFSDRLEGRVGLNTFSYSENDTYSGVDYSVDLDFQSVSLLADWRPYKGSFYVTAGALINNNEVNAQGKETGATIGDTTFSGEAKFDATIKFDKISPYLGLGYRKKSPVKGLSFTAEAGVLFQNDPEVRLDVEVPASSGITQADVETERQLIQDDLSGLEYWPVVSVGFLYQF